MATERDVVDALLTHKQSYLKNLGWFRTVLSQGSTDGNASPIPWMTYPMLHFLRGRVKREFSIFEYGSGNSTLWWAQHCRKVVSVEHDQDWYGKIQSILPPNVEYHFCELETDGEYSKVIQNYDNRFHIINIDGRDRVNCMRNCLDALRPDGVVILDNSDRKKYKPGTDHLVENGFRRIDFIGMGPVNLGAWGSSVFYRDSNCLGI